jgi:hypothetical protein
MKKKELVRLYPIFTKDMVHPERVTTSGRIDIKKKE